MDVGWEKKVSLVLIHVCGAGTQHEPRADLSHHSSAHSMARHKDRDRKSRLIMIK